MERDFTMTTATIPISTREKIVSRTLLQQLTAGSFAFIAFTGLARPTLLTIFEFVAILILAINYKAILYSQPIKRAWLFLALNLLAFGLHISQPDIPIKNAYIFIEAGLSCTIIASLLSVMKINGQSYKEATKPYIFGVAISSIFALGILLMPSLADLPITTIEIRNTSRNSGLSNHSNLLGLHAGIALLLLQTTSVTTKTKLVLGSFAVLGISLSASRSAILFLIVSLLIMLVISQKGKQRRQVIKSLAVLSIASFIFVSYSEQGEYIWQRLSGNTGVTGDAERFELFQIGLENVQNHWLLGSAYEGRLFHNIYLTYLGVLGVIGLISLLIFFSTSIFTTYKKLDTAESRTALAIMLSLLITLLFHNAVAEPVIWFVFLSPFLIKSEIDQDPSYAK